MIRLIALLVLLTPARMVAADPGLDLLLQRMTRAVLAGEVAEYLDCVDRRDPAFSIEQQNWAADLERHVPSEFEFRFKEPPTLSDGWADGKVVMTWKMKGGASRSLEYPARFSNDSERGWLYAGEKWIVVEGNNVRALCAEGLEDVGKVVVEILPAIREHVHEGFGLTEDDIVGRVQPVKLYSSMKHLQQSIYLSYTDALGGWNEPHEAIKILARAGTGPRMLRTLLAHEYGHVATFELGDKASAIPWWILEGVAELSAENYSRGRTGVDRTVRNWASSGGLIEWERLADFRGEAANHYSHVYTQGHHMVGYISDRFGRAARNDWLTRMAAGATPAEATSAAFGVTFEELDAQWRESLTKPTEPKPDK